MSAKWYYVYILTTKKRGVLYIVMTGDLEWRMDQHRNGLVEGFTKLYKINRLVYFEQTQDVYAAIQREKALKKWRRAWKIELIERHNPEWQDLVSENGTVVPLPFDWDIRPPRTRG